MANVFLSYSSKEKWSIQQFAEELKQLGYTVWWDREIPIGTTYTDEIERQIKEADCIIVIWTQTSVQSQWVKNEATIADRMNKLVPVMLEQVDIPLAFMHIETAILTKENKDHHDNEMNLLVTAIERSMKTKRTEPIPMPPPPLKDTFKQKKWVIMIAAFILLSACIGLLWKSKAPNTQNLIVNGRVKTSDEKPIANVELNVEGTLFVCTSQTDGSYHLVIPDIQPNEPIAITTSHKDYADKTISITGTNELNLEKDIYLSPIQ